MHIGFYITNDKNKSMELPLPPSDVTVSSESDDTTEKVIKLGEINRVGSDKLKSLEIQTTIPVDTDKAHYPTARNLWKKGSSYITRLQSIYDSRKPCRVVLSGKGISFKCTIQKFQYGFNNGNADEYQIDVVFVQYKQAKAQSIVNSSRITKTGKRRSKPNHKISRGASITVNGSLYRNSSGKGKTGTVRNRQVDIGLVAKGDKAPYLIKSGDNTLGWIKKGAILS